MPEIDNNQTADQDVDKQPDAGEKKPDVEQDKKPTDDGTGKPDVENKDGGDPNLNKDKGQVEDKKDAKVPQVVKADDDEPPVRDRKNPKDFIIKRQKDKIDKLKGNQPEKKDVDEDDEDEDGEVAPDDKKVIKKVLMDELNPILAPIMEKNIKAEDDVEIAQFLKDNPDFAPYEAKARKYISHPSRRHLPIKTIFYEVAGDDLIKIGAEREKKATDKAKGTQTGGGSNRGGDGGGKGVWDKTKEEFEAEQEAVRRGANK